MSSDWMLRLVSGSFFGALGVKAALGRTLAASDDQRNGRADGPVAVINDGFGADNSRNAARTNLATVLRES